MPGIRAPNPGSRLAAIVSLDVVDSSVMAKSGTERALQELNSVFRTIVRPAVREEGGRVVKLMGDGALLEFASAGAALRAAHRIQRTLIGHRVRLRAGVHAGDVHEEAGDIFGEAMSIATRLQGAARPGDGLVSRLVVDLAGAGLNASIALKSEGALRLKGFERPVEALSLNVAQAPRAALVARGTGAQNVRFATSRDGTSLAWTATGDGPTLVKAPNWISHLELDWTTIAGAYLPDLAARTRLVRFDQRANGLSDRSVAEVSMERFVDDLEAVFDAAGVSRAPLFCISQGGPIGASFAARRPDLVSGLIVMGGFRQGVLVRSEPRHIAFTEALDAMSRTGWDDAYPSVRDHFATLLAPDAARDDQRALAEAMRASIEAEAFGRFREVVGRFDVTAVLDEVECPALILHGTGDRLHPIEQGRSFAARIRDSRFVALQTNNHVMPSYDPAWSVALGEIERFLAQLE